MTYKSYYYITSTSISTMIIDCQAFTYSLRKGTDLEKSFLIVKGTCVFATHRDPLKTTPVVYFTMYKGTIITKIWYFSLDGIVWTRCNKARILIKNGDDHDYIILDKKFAKLGSKKAKDFLIEYNKILSTSSTSSTSTNKPECIVCLSNLPVYMIDSCKHVLYCEDCWEKLITNRTSCAYCSSKGKFSKIIFV